MTQNQKQPSGNNTSQDVVRNLLARYFRAMARFYLVIPLEEAMELTREQNPDLRLSEEETEALIQSLTDEKGFRIDREPLPDGMVELPPLGRIVSPMLGDTETLDYVKTQKQFGYWLWPEREELLAYEDGHHVAMTDAADALFAFLIDTVMLPPVKAEEIIRQLHRDRAIYVLDDETYLRRPVQLLKKQDVTLHGEELRDLITLVNEAARQWPNPLTNGFTPEDIEYLKKGYVPVDSAVSLGPNCKRRIRAGEEEMMNDLTRLLLADRMPQRSIDRIITQAEHWMAPEMMRENRKMFEQLRDPYYRQSVRARMGVGEPEKVPTAVIQREARPQPKSVEVQETEKAEKSEDAEPFAHVGRNDPCPCGSGKKYKKCCGRPGRTVQTA